MNIITNMRNSALSFVGLFSASLHAESQVASKDVLSNIYSHQVIDYGQVVYGTLTVLVLLGMVVFLLKKSRLNKLGQHGLVEVIKSYPISTKDKLLVIKAGQDYLLLGVSGGGINKLHTLDVSDIEMLANPINTQSQKFSNIYTAMMGRFNNA